MALATFITQADKEKASFIWYAFKFIKDKGDAEDMVQDAFMDVINLQDKSPLVEYKKFRNRIFRSLRWKCLNSLRHKKPVSFDSIHEEDQPIDVIIEQIDVDRIAPIIEKLNRKEKEVLYLSMLGKKTFEIGNLLKIPSRQVENLRYMACKKVREEDIKLNR